MISNAINIQKLNKSLKVIKEGSIAMVAKFVTEPVPYF
jgi:hypothetical protein